MILIQKSTAPQDLAELQQDAKDKRLSPEDAYKTLRNPLKERIRNQLLNDQGHICAYCMCKIPRNHVPPNIAPVVIEHIIARNPADRRDVGQGLDYNNLLAVCHGNRNIRGLRKINDLICDAHRQNCEFRKINPMDHTTLESIFYSLDGKIDAADPDVRYDLLDILNLNCPSAPVLSERKAALDELIYELENIPDEEIGLFCRIMLHRFQEESDPKTPYVGILIWYLKSLIKNISDVDE